MPTTRTPIAALLAAILLLAAACGSGADSSADAGDTAELPTLQSETEPESATNGGEDTSTDADDEPVDPEIAMAEYERCLADAGIELPEASTDGDAMVLEFEADENAEGGFDDPEAFDEAFAKCDELLTDAFGEFEMTPEEEAEMADQMLEMQRCLADLGFDIDFGDGTGAFELDQSIDFEEFDAAMQECSPEGGESSVQEVG